jgi:hypothetical protein
VVCADACPVASAASRSYCPLPPTHDHEIKLTTTYTPSPANARPPRSVILNAVKNPSILVLNATAVIPAAADACLVVSA